MFNTQFRTEFSQIIKGVKQYDKSGKIGTIYFSEPEFFDLEEKYSDYRNIRVTWPNEVKSVKLKTGLFSKIKVPRFRMVVERNYTINEKKKVSSQKLFAPTFYLGLSRLFPYGETDSETSKSNSIHFENPEDEKWYIDNYKKILNLEDNIIEINSTTHSNIPKKTIGISTDFYNYETNSAGQDNIGQILLALLSFKRLKRNWEHDGNKWKGGLLLIDELDATLHPAAQLKLFKTLFKFGTENSIQIIFTTHSLYLLKNVYTLMKQHNYKNNCEVINMTRRNNVLNVETNPSFDILLSDLTLENPYNNSVNQKAPTFTEDDETIWFIEKAVPELLNKINIIHCKISCTELLQLKISDSDFFSKMLMVLDGDVESHEDTRKKLVQAREILTKNNKKINNIVLLPTNKRPESIFYDYLINLDSNHPYLKNNPNIGIMMFKEHGPYSDDYLNLKLERDKFKKWFNDNLNMFEATNLFDYWKNDNSELLNIFKKNMEKAINTVIYEINSDNLY